MEENELHEELQAGINILAVRYGYLVIVTKFTIHYLERLMPSCKDRGRFKWFAETKTEAWYAMKKEDEEARSSHVDGGDLFPRLYFYGDTFLKEFHAWLDERKLKIISVEMGKI